MSSVRTLNNKENLTTRTVSIIFHEKEELKHAYSVTRESLNKLVARLKS